jgi:Vanillate O-demethylase oxygenase C-terminal domain
LLQRRAVRLQLVDVRLTGCAQNHSHQPAGASNSATPVDDGSIQLIQILYRNDREEDCSTAELIAWDKAIIEEDRDILESTDPDAIVDMSRKLEMHMPSDRPRMLMRKRLNALLEAHGEREVPR